MGVGKIVASISGRPINISMVTNRSARAHSSCKECSFSWYWRWGRPDCTRVADLWICPKWWMFNTGFGEQVWIVFCRRGRISAPLRNESPFKRSVKERLIMKISFEQREVSALFIWIPRPLSEFYKGTSWADLSLKKDKSVGTSRPIIKVFHFARLNEMSCFSYRSRALKKDHTRGKKKKAFGESPIPRTNTNEPITKPCGLQHRSTMSPPRELITGLCI